MTRRDIFEALSSLNLWGRLEEIEFLDRLYDLDALPSEDGRFKTARRDIAQHRLLNSDWDDDWIFYDQRLGLSNGDDEVLLRFLSELLHPVVRADQEEVARIKDELNRLLGPEGYRLEPYRQISGRPVIHAVEIDPVPLGSKAPDRHFTEDVRPLVDTVARLAQLDGSDLEQEVLQRGAPTLEEPEYDNWDGGTYYYTLTLEVPVELFGRLGDQVRVVEEKIGDRIRAVLRAPDHHHVSAVVIQPKMVEGRQEAVAEVVAARSERPIPQFWAPGQFRLFISHVTSFKQRATALRQTLSKYHISGFVAHETIEPGELWQREIEAALRSMHAMAALLTPEFSESHWTDQEVGWALGAGIYVLPVRRGSDPYGFIGEIQGIQGMGKTVREVADGIFTTLLRQSSTRSELLEALTDGFESSDSYREARQNIVLLERASPLPSALLTRIEVSSQSNHQIRAATGVPERIQRLLNSEEAMT